MDVVVLDQMLEIPARRALAHHRFADLDSACPDIGHVIPDDPIPLAPLSEPHGVAAKPLKGTLFDRAILRGLSLEGGPHPDRRLRVVRVSFRGQHPVGMLEMQATKGHMTEIPFTFLHAGDLFRPDAARPGAPFPVEDPSPAFRSRFDRYNPRVLSTDVRASAAPLRRAERRWADKGKVVTTTAITVVATPA